MGAPVRKELKLLRKYARHRNLLIETGGGGSTRWIARAVRETGGKFYSIDISPSLANRNIEGVHHLRGWSISEEDIVKPGEKGFADRPRYKGADKDVAFGKREIKGAKNLIRTIISENHDQLDFFFCDTGEYCGLAEWRIVRDEIVKGGIFACHDIYYPKSIKCFNVAKEIKRSKKWKVLARTKSRQGLLIACKIS